MAPTPVLATSVLQNYGRGDRGSFRLRDCSWTRSAPSTRIVACSKRLHERRDRAARRRQRDEVVVIKGAQLATVRVDRIGRPYARLKGSHGPRGVAELGAVTHKEAAPFKAQGGTPEPWIGPEFSEIPSGRWRLPARARLSGSASWLLLRSPRSCSTSTCRRRRRLARPERRSARTESPKIVAHVIGARPRSESCATCYDEAGRAGQDQDEDRMGMNGNRTAGWSRRAGMGPGE